MHILQNGELFSSYIALCALFFAIFEFHLRAYNETIQKVGELYSKILSTCQQLQSQVLSVKKLSENLAIFSEEEVIGYANSYLRNENLTSSFHEIMGLTLPCFNLKEKPQEINSVKKIYNFTSIAISLEASITAFYQGILAGSKYQASEINKIYKRMNKYLTIVVKHEAQKIVMERLTSFREISRPHYSLWILICILILVLIEFFLRI